MTELEVLALMAKVRNQAHRASDGRSWVDVSSPGELYCWVEITWQADALEAAGQIVAVRNRNGWWAAWEHTGAGETRTRQRSPGRGAIHDPNPLDVARAVELYATMSLREVVALMKVHHPRIRQALVDAGVPIRTGRGPAKKASTP